MLKRKNWLILCMIFSLIFPICGKSLQAKSEVFKEVSKEKYKIGRAHV